MSRRILITGASGFVGGHLIGLLLQTDSRITAVDLVKPHEHLLEQCGGRVKWVQADLVKDDLSEHLAGIDTVYHLAAAFKTGNSDSIFNELCTLNVEGTKKMAAASIKSGVGRFVHVSSVAAGERADTVKVTEANGKPVSSYGLSKLRSEEALKEVADKKMRYVILRPAFLFGEFHRGSVFELVSAIRRGRFVIIGSGLNHVNFLYVKDFAGVLQKVVDKPEMAFETCLVADTPITVKDMVSFIRNELNLPQSKFRLPLPAGLAIGAAFDVLAKITHRSMPLSVRRVRAMTRDTCYSNEKLTAASITPEYGIFEGLKRTIAWYKSQNLI